MKTIKRKARRIADRTPKKNVAHNDKFMGNEKELLDKVVEVIVKIIKREVGL